MPTTQETPTTSPIGRDTPRVDGPLKVTGTGAVHLRLPLSRDAVCRAGRGDDRQRPRGQARHGRGRENARRARDFSSREHRKDLPLGPGSRDSKASATSGARRSRTTSFATTANTSRWRWRTRSRPPRPLPMRFASPTPRKSRTSRPTSKRTTSPTWLPPRSARATRLQSQRGDAEGAFATRAGQARPDLCHADRDAQPHRAARDDRDLGRIDADAVRVVAGSRQPPEACSRRCSACRRRTSASSPSSSARVSAASCGRGRIVRSPPRRRGSSASRSSSWSAAR